MFTKDNDKILQLWAFYKFLDNWSKENSHLDTKKIGTIRQNVKLLIREISKKQGINAVDSILEECEKYIFGFIPKNNNETFIDTCELGILKNAIKKVVDKSSQCEMCDRCDYKYCEMFTIKKFLNQEGKKSKKGCPYKKSIDDIFNIKDDLGE